MGFALIFLGLVPLLFMGDGLFGASADAETDDLAEPEGLPTRNLAELGEVLQPVTGDEEPVPGAPVDPDTVLSPNVEDAAPVDGLPVDPETVLDPVDVPGEGYVAGDGTTLQMLIDESSDLDVGLDWLGDQMGDVDETLVATDIDVLSLPDDGVEGTGEGLLADWDGTPIIVTEGALHVVDGGAGDDVLAAGDEAAYLFGGDGDDVLRAGEGAAALFGGAGSDVLSSDTTGAFLDGGEGDDVIAGGAGDDVIFGGAHATENADLQDNDMIDGGAGNDRISGGYGADVLLGGDGDDVINHLGHVGEEVSWERHSFDWHLDGASDHLDGGTGNDVLIMDRFDSASGGEGIDTFWVYFDMNGAEGFADVQDFETGVDFLRVTLNPGLDVDAMEVDVQPSADGLDSVVTLNGEVVAMLRGAPDATLADVMFEAPLDVFAG